MIISKVKWFDDIKGYGFIEHSDRADVFVHYSSIIAKSSKHKTLVEGQYVKFELVETDKGLHAKNVIPINSVKEVNLLIDSNVMNNGIKN